MMADGMAVMSTVMSAAKTDNLRAKYLVDTKADRWE